jgi:hypothetical protein
LCNKRAFFWPFAVSHPYFSEIDLLRKYGKYDVGLNPRYYYLDG